MRILVNVLDKKLREFAVEIRRLSRKLCALLNEKGDIEVFLIDSGRLRRLNKKFRGLNKSTNVLSFVVPKGFPGAGLGEIYLDPIYIKEHKEDAALMLAHGVLHILGYDHEKENDRIKMENKERQLMKQFHG